MTSQNKLSKDQIQKLVLSSIGFVVLLYVYFNFFLGPLNRSRVAMEGKAADLQTKLGNSKSEMLRATKLEEEAGTATTRFAALQALSPDGAPIAWFPPRIKAFFANQHIEKAIARLGTSTAFTEPELANWMKYSWMIDIPQADYDSLGTAVAELENSEPLLSISKLTIHTQQGQPQFQQVEIVALNVIQKK
jgi:hypothetical protein